MLPKTNKMSSTTEMSALQSRRKRTLSTESLSTTPEVDDYSASDFEAKPPIKSVANKRQKISSAGTNNVTAKEAAPGLTLAQGMAAIYAGSGGHAFFSKQWWTEISATDAFWIDFVKKVPKRVIAKRLRIEVATNLSPAPAAVGTADAMFGSASALTKTARPRVNKSKVTATTAPAIQNSMIDLMESNTTAAILNSAFHFEEDTGAQHEPIVINGNDIKAKFDAATDPVVEANETLTKQVDEVIKVESLVPESVLDNQRRVEEELRENIAKMHASMQRERQVKKEEKDVSKGEGKQVMAVDGEDVKEKEGAREAVVAVKKEKDLHQDEEAARIDDADPIMIGVVGKGIAAKQESQVVTDGREEGIVQNEHVEMIEVVGADIKVGAGSTRAGTWEPTRF